MDLVKKYKKKSKKKENQNLGDLSSWESYWSSFYSDMGSYESGPDQTIIHEDIHVNVEEHRNDPPPEEEVHLSEQEKMRIEGMKKRQNIMMINK